MAARSGPWCHLRMAVDELHVLPHPRNGAWLVDGPTRHW
jgi:hypothetical protein